MAALVNIFKVKASIHVSLLTSNFQQTSIPNNHQKLPLQSNTSDNCPQVFRKLHQCHQKPILCNCLMNLQEKQGQNAAFSRKSPGTAPKPPPTETQTSPPPKPPLALRDAGEPPESSRSPTLWGINQTATFWWKWRCGICEDRGAELGVCTSPGEPEMGGGDIEAGDGVSRALCRSLSLSLSYKSVRTWASLRVIFVWNAANVGRCRGAVWLAHVCPG